MTVIEKLLPRNAAFAESHFSPARKIIPSLKTMIIACVGPRVDPAVVLGLVPGEAAVIRKVGGRIFPSTLQTMALSRSVAAANGGDLGEGWNLILLQHTDCGINCLVHLPEGLARHFRVAAAELGPLAVTDPYEAVAVDVAALKANPQLPGGFLVTGLVYDVGTGRIATVVPSARLRPTS